MAKDIYFREGRILKRDGDIEFDMLTIDGIALPPYPVSRAPGGYPKRINEIINFETRPNDVLLATYPKSGTHWMTEILDMLVRGNAEYSKERLLQPLELIDSLDTIIDQQSRRVLHTHLPYKWFPRKHIENGGKIVTCIRNPKDAYVSMYHHCCSGLEFGEKTKGMTWTQFFDNCVIGKDCLYGTWFDYVKQISEAKKHNKNIHTVHYENIKSNLENEIKAIATFLNLPVSDALIRDITQKCSFSNLKKAYDEIKDFKPEVHKKIEDHIQIIPGFQIPNIFRKGIVGDWKNHFTVAQNEQFDALYKREIIGSDTEFSAYTC